MTNVPSKIRQHHKSQTLRQPHLNLRNPNLPHPSLHLLSYTPHLCLFSLSLIHFVLDLFSLLDQLLHLQFVLHHSPWILPASFVIKRAPPSISQADSTTPLRNNAQGPPWVHHHQSLLLVRSNHLLFTRTPTSTDLSTTSLLCITVTITCTRSRKLLTTTARSPTMAKRRHVTAHNR